MKSRSGVHRRRPVVADRAVPVRHGQVARQAGGDQRCDTLHAGLEHSGGAVRTRSTAVHHAVRVHQLRAAAQNGLVQCCNKHALSGGGADGHARAGH